MAKVIPEKAIENQILHWLFKKGIYAWKNQTTGIFDPVKKIYRRSHNPFHRKGVADILGVLPTGQFLGIEVKSQNGRASPEQLAFIDSITSSGGIAFIARSVEEVIEKLECKK